MLINAENEAETEGDTLLCGDSDEEDETLADEEGRFVKDGLVD